MKNNKNKTDKHILANNKRASYDYFIQTTYEAGISLKGVETVSIKRNGCSLHQTYISIENNEAYILNLNVSKLENTGAYFTADPVRKKKLLLHKKEIKQLQDFISKSTGNTIIPLDVYIKDGLIKLTIAECKGKHLYDKRNSIAEKDVERRIQREMRV